MIIKFRSFCEILAAKDFIIMLKTLFTHGTISLKIFTRSDVPGRARLHELKTVL